MTSISRLDRSLFARWWWSVDRISLALLAAIILSGCILLLAAGPSAAERLGIDRDFHFSMRQAIFLPPAVLLMIATSMLSPLQARRLGVIVFISALILMFVALVIGPKINGAHRWLSFGSFLVQPSEFLKPGFVVVAAWMLAEGARDPKFPGAFIAMGMFAVSAFLLILQPDFGQTALLTAIWMIMFFIAGWSWIWIAVLSAVGASAIFAGYLFSPHLAKRINGFVNPDGVETYQVDKAQQTIQNGGWFGRSPEAFQYKTQLPDAHTDFIFAVAAEEFGFIFSLLIILLFAALIVRVYVKAASLNSLFAQCAVCGMAAMVGLQSFINIGVSLRALPAKGMTLPFISYGGSSLIAMGLSVGIMLALLRAPRMAIRRREVMP